MDHSRKRLRVVASQCCNKGRGGKPTFATRKHVSVRRRLSRPLPHSAGAKMQDSRNRETDCSSAVRTVPKLIVLPRPRSSPRGGNDRASGQGSWPSGSGSESCAPFCPDNTNIPPALWAGAGLRARSCHCTWDDFDTGA